MKARDAPELTPLLAPKQPQDVTISPSRGTGTTKAVKSSKLKAEAPAKKTRQPASRKGARPPNVAGYTWRKDGAGWQLRKSVYESDGTGTTKRKRPYVAHLSKSAFQEMKRLHRGAALNHAIAEWIKTHDKGENA